MNPGYKIERVSSEGLKDLILLYKNAFAKNISLQFLQKKFDTKVFGAEYIGFIAYADEQAAAYYGLFPCRAMYRGDSMLCAVSGDTMTHTEHRGKGLFVELAKRTFQLAKEEGIKFAYGFPNQNSLKGSIDAGWQYFGDHLKLFTLNVNTIPLAKLAKKLNLKQAVNGDMSEQFANSLNVGGCILHDANYFKYKSYSPKTIITIAGTRVWCKNDGVLKIGDVERISAFDTKLFLDELKSYAFRNGITEVQFMISTGTWLDIELSKHLEGKNVFPVAHIAFDTKGIDLNKMKYGMGDLDTF